MRRSGDGRPPLLPSSLLALGLLACGAAPEGPAVDAEVRSLLAAGAAKAEIEQWGEALERFRRAAELAPNEAAAAYDVAVALLRSGEAAAAGEWVDRAATAAPPEFLPRVEYLRGRLAYERGDPESAAAAYRRAAELAPDEAAYPYALAQIAVQLESISESERGALLERALRLRPDNARLASEYALWALAEPAPEVRAAGLQTLEGLVALTPEPEVARWAEEGRAELARNPSVSGVPGPLRRALNLLRPGKRFQADSAALEESLQVAPLWQPVSQPVSPDRAAAAALAAPPVSFASASLLPPPPLRDGERLLAVAPLIDAVDDGDAVAAGPGAEGQTLPRREAGLVAATGERLLLLPRDAADWRELALHGSIVEGAGVHGLQIAELDGDGRMEILALTPSGLRAWTRAADGEWKEDLAAGRALAGHWDDLLPFDFEHDGDLDLLLRRGDALLLATNRGEAGFGDPTVAPLGLPAGTAARAVAAGDLDGDGDQDLVLATAEELTVLLNWRQGEWANAWRRPESPPAERLALLDYDADGLPDVVALAAGEPLFRRNAGGGELRPDPALAEGAGRFSVSVAAPADVDLDGDLDLLLAGTGGDLDRAPGDDAADGATPRIAILLNHGRRGFSPAPESIGRPGPEVRGLLALDLDGDADTDLLAWSDAGLETWEGRGAEAQGWLALALRGLPQKVPLDARGVRVMVAGGEGTRWRDPTRPEVVVGLGGDRPAVVKITWPNGISEYLFDPEPRRLHHVEQVLRLEGSCPFLYAWDGDRPRFVTDILGLSPLGMLAGPGVYVPPDPEEYLRLPDWVEPRDGLLELRLTEELREAAYIDQAELLVVDAPAGVEVYNHERWLPEPVAGPGLHLLAPLRPPVSVLDHDGREVLDLVAEEDRVYLGNGWGRRRYQGAVTPHRITIELPSDLARASRPVLVLTGWLHWGNTSTNVARAQDPRGAPLFPVLEVPDRNGGWARRDAAVGLPAGKTKPVVVELAGLIDPADPRLRLTTDFEVYWDRIAVAAALPAGTPHRVHRLPPRDAELDFGGFSRWYRPAANGPYLFDYGERRPYPWRESSSGAQLPISWLELEGRYTAFGSVGDLLRAADDRLVVFGSGEELVLRFDLELLPPLAPGWRRTWFLHSEGWEKDGDPNVACGQTVGPLPYRAMASYPCPGPADAREDGSEAGDRRDRWVSARRLERRLAALAVAPADF